MRVRSSLNVSTLTHARSPTRSLQIIEPFPIAPVSGALWRELELDLERSARGGNIPRLLRNSCRGRMANLHEAGQEHLKFLSVYFCLKMTTLKHLGHLLRQAMGLEDPKRSKDLAHLVEQ